MRCGNSSRGRQLLARGRQPALDLLGRVGRRGREPALDERLERGRLDEDLRRFGQRLAHLPRALDVDLEHDSARRALELAAQRAVAVAGVLGVLHELARAPPGDRSPRWLRKW